MTRLSEWLELMLAEIARRAEQEAREREELLLREAERKTRDSDGSPATRR